MRTTTQRTTRAVAAVLAAILLATLTISGGVTDAAAQAETTAAYYKAELRNVMEGNYLTPPNFAAHDADLSVFVPGHAASPGVQAVAENGGVPVLAAELAAAVDATGRGVSLVGADAPIAPGASVSWEFSTDAPEFSLVSMIICSNDGFGGLDNKTLPRFNDQSRTYAVRGWDAGTEINTEMRADLVGAPFCGEGDGSGASNPELAEGGVISRHLTLRGTGDLDPILDWEGPVAELVITRVEHPNNYSVTVENITTGQYLTPPNFAAHNASVDVFERGQAASPGVQAVAENGGVPILAAELAAAIDAQGLGVSGVGAAAPLAPGATSTFDFTTTENRISIVSMIICTNDGFAGIDARGLPAVGETVTLYARGLDAGTEINTEMRADLVGAPFCGEGDGSGASNPELAENGVIGRHPTQQGVGDLADSLDWSGPVMAVTITNNG